MSWRRRCSQALALLALALPLACGGSGGPDDAAAPGEVLFAGEAGELVPHALRRTAAYRVAATVDGATEVSSFRATVTEDRSDGVFQTRYESASGALARSVSRDGGSELRVERFVNDPGGPDARDVLLDPPVVVVRTPVVAGDAIETSFARALDLRVTVGDATERRQVLFVGSARRVPVERDAVTVPDGTFDAIRYAVEARGEASVPILGASLAFVAEVRGDEWFAPGVGGVKEELEVRLSAGDATAVVRFVTERVSGSVR